MWWPAAEGIFFVVRESEPAARPFIVKRRQAFLSILPKVGSSPLSLGFPDLGGLQRAMSPPMMAEFELKTIDRHPAIDRSQRSSTCRLA
jgi:hypothetical protein